MKRTVKFYELWDNIIYNSRIKNMSENGEYRNSSFYVDMKAIYSGSRNVTYMYTIDGLPPKLEVDFHRKLREKCKEGVRISFTTSFEKYVIKWNSPQMKAKLKTWRTLDNQAEDMDEYNMHSNLALLDSQQWKRDSLTYLNEAEIRRNRKTFRVRTIMYVSGERGSNFDDTIDDLTKLCSDLGIKATRVMYNIPEYMKVFSPFSMHLDDKVIKDTGSNVLTDEIIARFNTCSQGTIGTHGVYFGTDIFSYFPCLKPVKRTTESAENWLITAETGGGKSFFVKALILQLLGSKYYNGTIMDIEGFEYLPIAYYLASSNPDGVVILNMAEGSGSYFDPVEVVLVGDEEQDATMYSLSKSFTLSYLKTLTGASEEYSDWSDIVIEDAVGLVYSEAGVVDDDMSTWERSKGLTLFSCYSRIVKMRDVDNIDNEDYRRAVKYVLAKLSRYFEPNGTRCSVFRNRVAVGDIAHAKLVVCSFGMAGKAPSTVDPVQMALMQLSAANISHLRSIFSKVSGKFNFKLWEEFQRWGSFPDSDKTISTALTGGRKLGDINIILTNALKKLLDNDKFDLLENVQTFAIGCIGDSDVRRDICERLSVPNMLPELDRLVTENKDLSSYSKGDTSNESPYSKAFLVGLDRTVFTVSKMMLPRNLAECAIFRTGINKRED